MYVKKKPLFLCKALPTGEGLGFGESVRGEKSVLLAYPQFFPKDLNMAIRFGVEGFGSSC